MTDGDRLAFVRGPWGLRSGSSAAPRLRRQGHDVFEGLPGFQAITPAPGFAGWIELPYTFTYPPDCFADLARRGLNLAKLRTTRLDQPSLWSVEENIVTCRVMARTAGCGSIARCATSAPTLSGTLSSSNVRRNGGFLAHCNRQGMEKPLRRRW